MTAQGNALGNKSATMTNALKGRNKVFNPTNGGKCFALSGLSRFGSLFPRALPWADMLRPLRGKGIHYALRRYAAAHDHQRPGRERQEREDDQPPFGNSGNLAAGTGCGVGRAVRVHAVRRLVAVVVEAVRAG